MSDNKIFELEPEWREKDFVISRGEKALKENFVFISDYPYHSDYGDKHDYHSDSDYWWPNPDTEDGLPFIRKDGLSNPNNFQIHRKVLRHMRRTVVYLAAAYVLSEDERFAKRAVDYLEAFFLDPATYMRPALDYAQAIPGVSIGRGPGVIDTLHLVDVPEAIRHLNKSNAMTQEIYHGLEKWFASYLGWLLTSKNGIAEMQAKNNHAVCFFVQAAAFASFTKNERILEFCRSNFKEHLLEQLDRDGSLPQELARTKPYAYSLFAVDNFINLAWFIGKDEGNVKDYFNIKNSRGATLKDAAAFIRPYIFNKESWPYPKDVSHFDAFPTRFGSFLIAGYITGDREIVDFYWNLPSVTEDKEARRNTCSREVMLWLT